MSVDILGLQELDAGRQRSAGVDQAAFIAKQLGCHHLFQPALRNGNEEYGNAIISRYPMRLRRRIDLPGCGTWYCRETRVAIWAEIDTPLGRTSIINTHLGLGRGERFLQAQLLARTDPTDDPLILLGDLNSLPGSRPHELLTGSLQDIRAVLGTKRSHCTFPTQFPIVAVDHIFASATLQPLSLTTHRTKLARIASDHYPLVAEFART
jgi:endonuclease/exonuclease/phosphatase family metal-dependent hydrolase